MRSVGAIVIGGYINGLGLVRALAARHIPIAVITTKPYDIAHRSRWTSTHDPIVGLDEQPDHLLALLERRSSAWSGWAIFPTNDGAMTALAQHWDRLSRTYRIVAPSPEVAPYLLDKERMLAVARAVGVDVPHCYGAAIETTAARRDLRFPVVVKPVIGYRFFARFGCKLFVATDHDELIRCIERLAEVGLAGEIFDLIPGADSEIYAYCTYVDAQGHATAGLTVRKLRQSPPFFGVARAARIAPDEPQLRDATLAILRRIGFRGMAVAEFKRDTRDGTFRFLEINGRSVIYNALLRRGGLDLAALGWSDYVDAQPAVVEPKGWSGTWINCTPISCTRCSIAAKRPSRSGSSRRPTRARSSRLARHEVPIIVVIFNNRSYNGPRNKVLNAGGRQAQAGKEMSCYLGDPDVDFVQVAAGFGVGGELLRSPDEIRPAIQRAIDRTREGQPYVIDALVARTGVGADSTWYPRYSVAAARVRKV